MPRSSASPETRSIHRSVFRNLHLSMLAFGFGVGVLFPPFAAAVLETPAALTGRFFAMCVAAGLIVGAANYFLFRVVVSRELRRVVGGMRHVNEAVATAEDTGEGCRDNCRLEVASRDLIGEVADSFNRMTEAIARRITTESTTRKLLVELSATADLDQVAARILRSMGDVVGGKAGVLYGQISNAQEFLTSFGADVTDRLPRTLDASSGLVSSALSSGEVITLSPVREGFEWMELSSPLGTVRPGSLLLAPLMAKRRAVGLAVLACGSDELPPERLALLEAIRTQAAPHLQTAILHRKLRDLAAIDDLTHILNRRFGMRRLTEEFSRALRHGVPVSVLMIDIDHFKQFNDTFGHDAGDAVLTAVASTLESNVRSGDVACRYGGEELLVVAPGMGLSDAAESAERIRRLVETTAVHWGGRTFSVTVSIGAASWPIVRASTPEELVAAADKALYFAKESGRNQVALHQGEDAIPLAVFQAELK